MDELNIVVGESSRSLDEVYADCVSALRELADVCSRDNRPELFSEACIALAGLDEAHEFGGSL